MLEVLLFIPEYGLYSLTLIGAYFVVPEFILFRRWRDPERPSVRRAAIVGVLLGLAFAAYPPATYPTPLGAFDRALRVFAPYDWLRISFFYLLAVSTCLRFRRIDAAFWVVVVTFAVNMKAQVGWEKYALPPLVTLWYLKSIHALDGGRFPLASRRREES